MKKRFVFLIIATSLWVMSNTLASANDLLYGFGSLTNNIEFMSGFLLWTFGPVGFVIYYLNKKIKTRIAGLPS